MDDNQIPVEIVKTPPPVSSYFKTLSAVLGVFVLVAGLGIAVKLSQQKQETRTKASADMVDLSLSADKTDAASLEEVNLAIGVNPHNYKVTAVELVINTSNFDIISLTPGNYLTSVLQPSSSEGSNDIHITLGSGTTPVTGPGILANLKVKVRSGASGTGTVTINSGSLVSGIDTNGDAIPTSILGDAGEATINITIPVATPSSFPTPTPVGTSKIGDANGDGKVDGSDYTPWVLNYGKTTANKALDGDFNEDGRVDGVDYIIWINNYL